MSRNTVSQRLPLFPISTRIQTSRGHERLTIADCDLVELAEQYGTPLYLYDQATLDTAAETYRRALAETYPGETDITYAGKAFLCVAMAQWVQHQDLWLDCTGVGELAIAATAGVRREQILVHGVNKGQADLAAALNQAGTIVVDNLSELERIIALCQQRAIQPPNLWLRLRPGVTVMTHAYAQTGQQDSKFGMDKAEATQSVQRCRRHRLPLNGLHFHLGSHFRDPAPIEPALEMALELMSMLHAESGWYPQALCPGGGWGIAYHEDELPHPAIEAYVHFVVEHLVAGCQRRGLPLPRLHLEPGRSLVARAGVALYRVGTVKHTAHRRWLLLDGGLTDNPRPALYGARYSALPVLDPRRPGNGPAWLAGPYCESGDVLIEALPFPDLEPGELIAVPVSGAYHLSMASNYNGARKPAVVWLNEAGACLIQKREGLEDLVCRDRPLSR